MVVGRSCATGPLPPTPLDVEVLDPVLPSLSLVLCDPVSAAWFADEVLLGAMLRDCELAYQYGLVVTTDDNDDVEEPESLLSE